MTSLPWYRTAVRWGQTNLVEIDPQRYDDKWWRERWRETRLDGVIVNAGGIVAYYPSKFPLHHRAIGLGDGDLYGTVVASARDEGLTVIARMDSNRVADDFYRQHPDWICLDADGAPIRAGDKYVTCINSPYYSEYLPGVMEEIVERSQPDGFADNSWAGLPRTNICYCRHCAEQFMALTGLQLPRRHDWSNEGYRQWIAWNYQCRIDLWDLNNRATTNAGGPDCYWMGMLSGDPLNNSNRFIDLREILHRSEIVMLDHQHRNGVDGFEQNTEAGKRLHELLGWDKLIPESMPQYQLGRPAFRVAAMPQAEVRLWSAAGFAGGIQPWWHHIGSMHEDRRQYQTAGSVFQWHEANAGVLLDRSPVADVAVVWSQHNNDYYGQDEARARALDPYRGAVKALNAAGIGFLPLHAADLAKAAGRFKVLVLPNVAAMSAQEISAVEAFVAEGGSVVATGETSLYTEHGDRRSDFGLGQLFGLSVQDASFGGQQLADPNIETYQRHTYLRLVPELRAAANGPRDATAELTEETRHPLLADLNDTDLLPFGGYLPAVSVTEDAQVLATLVPAFPIFPPETAWMRTPRTDIPALVVRETEQGGRLSWLVADLDRCYSRDEHPEHAAVLANAVRWGIGEQPTCLVDGHGLVAASLYEQAGRSILHLTNMVETSRVPGRQDQVVPVGPVRVVLQRPAGTTTAQVELRVSGEKLTIDDESDTLALTVPEVLVHEVVVVSWGA